MGHLRRRAALGWVLLAGVLVGCGQPARLPAREAARPGGGQAVPWVDQPAGPPEAPSRPSAPVPLHPSAPACAASALSIAALLPVQVTQDSGVAIEVRNAGRVPCVLTGTPTVSATTPGQARVLASAGAMPSASQAAYALPGGSVWLSVDAPLTCARDPGGAGRELPSYHRLVVSLPEGGRLEVGGVDLRFPCGMSTTPFYARVPPPPSVPDPLAELVPHLGLPPTTPDPGTLHYEVTLSNPGSRAVELSPCPTYIEFSSLPTKFLYRLNCSRVRSIPGRGQVTYRMEMTLPALAGLGSIRVGWTLLGPGTRSAGGRVQLR